MIKKFIAIAWAFALAFIASHSTSAGTPQSFNQWTIANGNIGAVCPANAVCENLNAFNGFLQRTIESGGQFYLQTIVTPPNLSGVPPNLPFGSESIIKTSELHSGSSAQFDGVANSLFLHNISVQGPITQKFDSQTTILTGWAHTPGQPLVSINQSLTETGRVDGDFSATFKLTTHADATGKRSYSDIDIWQDIYQAGVLPGTEFDSVYHLVLKQNSSGDRTGYRLAISQNVGLAVKQSTLENAEQTITLVTAGRLTDRHGNYLDTERQVFLLRRSDGSLMVMSGSQPSNDVMWIYHWTSTGLDMRQDMPLRGQWFACERIEQAGSNQTASGRCSQYSKHETYPEPSLPFDPNPLMVPTRVASRIIDAYLYPSVNIDTSGQYLIAEPGTANTPNGGGNSTGGNSQGGGNSQTITSSNLAYTPGPATGGYPAPPPVAIIHPKGTVAAEGLPFVLDGWTVNNGTITYNCPTNFKCKTLVSDNGLVQIEARNITNGKVYYQTVVTEKTSTGIPMDLAFSSEAVVRAGLSQELVNSGIVNRNYIKDSSYSLSERNTLQMGWARDPSTDPSKTEIELIQETEAGKFKYVANVNDKGEHTGFRLDIDQIGRDITEKADSSMVYTSLGGDMVTKSGTAYLPGGRGMTWQPGDYIRVIFISQKDTFEKDADDTRQIDYFTTQSATDDTSLDWNQGWGGWRHSSIGYDNLSDNKNQGLLISPKRSVAQYWLTDPFGDLASRFGITNMTSEGSGLTGSNLDYKCNQNNHCEPINTSGGGGGGGGGGGTNDCIKDPTKC